nr:KUP/HAK/KT family potassium transporter [Pseudomonadota bacterium]
MAENHQSRSPAVAEGPHRPKGTFAALALGAVGIVYGDIGTSPLYTIREAFGSTYGLEVSEFNVLGVLS